MYEFDFFPVRVVLCVYFNLLDDLVIRDGFSLGGFDTAQAAARYLVCCVQKVLPFQFVNLTSSGFHAHSEPMIGLPLNSEELRQTSTSIGVTMRRI